MDDPRFDCLQAETLADLPENALTTPDPSLSRRRLLGGAAGFVLAASGLLVPEGVEGVERQRPVERILNDPRERKDRNDKNRNDKNRNNKDRNGKDGNDNDLQEIQQSLDVELNFVAGNYLIHQVEVWQTKKGGGYELKWPRQSVPQGGRVKFTGSRMQLVLVLFNPQVSEAPLYFQAWNRTIFAPGLRVAQGIWDEEGRPLHEGHVYIDGEEMKEGDQLCLLGSLFCVNRESDSATHKIFTIHSAF